MRIIDTIRFVLLPCSLFILSTEIVCATSGWGNVSRGVGNDCSVFIHKDHCCVSTNHGRVRIRVWFHGQRPEYDFNSEMLFFRFHSLETEEATELERDIYLTTEKIDFDYCSVRQPYKPLISPPHISPEWTYFIVDKISGNISGPLTEEEFLKHPDALSVTKWNWKSPEKTKAERSRDNLVFALAFSVLIIFMFICMNFRWIVPLLIILIAIVYYRRRKRKLLKGKTTHEIRNV